MPDSGRARNGGRRDVTGIFRIALAGLAVATGGDAAWSAEPWWRVVDNGPFQADTIHTHRLGPAAALKGIAIKLGEGGEASVVFDSELLCLRAGFDGAVVLDGAAWSGSHSAGSSYPPGSGKLFFENPAGRGCAVLENWTDPRTPRAGSLPRTIGRFRGLFRHGRKVVLDYEVGGVRVLELPALEVVGSARAITRTFKVEPCAGVLEILVDDLTSDPGPVSPAPRRKSGVRISLVGAPPGVELSASPHGRTTVRVLPATTSTRFKVVYAEASAGATVWSEPSSPGDLLAGGSGLFPQEIAVRGEPGQSATGQDYVTDTVPLPVDNPWRAQARFGGFDFFADGRRAAFCSWNGDVWIADGLAGDLARVTWRRFASGLYQTLGLKIVNGVIYTQGRDQITRLHDLNGDGEADHYECFNNDVMTTTGFHEFTFDLQTDAAGNFYFAKGMPVLAGGRGFADTTPHNGAVLKVSHDGSRLERVAWGLRAPGGLGVGPGGAITTGENEGSFVPQCKITWTRPGEDAFHGVVPGRWEQGKFLGPLPGAPTTYTPPLCWLPYNADNSGGSQIWVPENSPWDRRHAGELLHLSYGRSGIFRVLKEEVGGTIQGGVYRLPVELAAAVMRARFQPHSGDLFVVGFRGWQTNGRDALQRIRCIGSATPVPVALHAHANGLRLRFSAPLDRATAQDPARYSVSKWNYVWGPQYGSGRFSIDRPDRAAEARALEVGSKGVHNQIDPVAIAAVALLEDDRTVFLHLPQMTPAMQMEVKYDLLDDQGGQVRNTVYHTVHALGASHVIPEVQPVESVARRGHASVGEPGLLLAFSEPTDVVRMERLALTVPEGTPPSVFLPARAFEATWQGQLVISERDAYRFALEGTGSATLLIDGREVLRGELPMEATVPMTLAQGAYSLVCSYRSTSSGAARIRLMWSSPQFRPEPVPAEAFRFHPSAELEIWRRVRTGRAAFAAAMCIRCHQPRTALGADGMPELGETGPSFENIGERLDSAWLEGWIASPRGPCPTVPAEQTADVTAFLRSLRRPEFGLSAVAVSPAAIARGAALVESRKMGVWVAALEGERRHTELGLADFLEKPHRYHPDSLWPRFGLKPDEASAVAAFVRSRQPVPSAALPAYGDPTKGRRVATTSCAACHAFGEVAPKAPTLEEIARADWSAQGCLSSRRGPAPELRLTTEQRDALLAFRNADRDVGLQSLRREVPAEFARRETERRGCFHCHTGDARVPGIARAGEKFTRKWLESYLAGSEPLRPRPWLEVRMPAFPVQAARLAEGLAALHGVTTDPEETSPSVAPESAAAGARLASPAVYSCVACHDAGSAKALQVFEGQGPNLKLAGQRLRPDYFQRWMHYPQRIQPTTIMPRYTSGRDGALIESHPAGAAARQFEAIWEWMRQLPD
jgi:mono/diheme cytochrome c family protein